MKIAIQGELGAYSHQAMLECYPEAEPQTHQTFEGAFEAVQNGEADLAMIPVENSTYGRVSDVHTLLPKAGLHIIGEHFLRIKINWYAKKGAVREKINKAISHPVLLGQCRAFMKENGLTWESWTDTAAAANLVANSDNLEISALSSALAGELHGLELLEEGVEDLKNNTTRFLVLSREAGELPKGDDLITTFVFEVRNIPAALYKAMGGFATNKVNMTKLESYMVDGCFTATQFYADIQGSPEEEGVKLALHELGFFTHYVQVLGCYEASPIRKDVS